ncbi:hypothetical protein, partial [Mycobacterium tuberculosis]
GGNGIAGVTGTSASTPGGSGT